MVAELTPMRNELTAANRVVPLTNIAVEPTPPIFDHPSIAKWKLRFQTNFADLDMLRVTNAVSALAHCAPSDYNLIRGR